MILCACSFRSSSGSAIGLVMLIAVMLPGHACAQSGAPIKIGYSMSLTGGLAPNGRSALLAQHIWEEETNAKGGMLGRPVKLIYYDDKSSPSEIPSIYTKLLDIDKVDLDYWRIWYGADRAGNADCHPKKEDISRITGTRRELPVQLSELFCHGPVWAGCEVRLHQRLF